MTFTEAMAETARMAKAEQKVMYLYQRRKGQFNWGLSATYWDDWLFKAYPGGRMVMSQLGKKHLPATEPPQEGPKP